MNLKIAYIGLTLLIIIVLLIIGFKIINNNFTDKTSSNNKKRGLVLGLLLWQSYIFVMAYMGMLDGFDFPPRFVIFTIFPLFAFTAIFIYRNRNNKWISTIPEHWLIFYQSFRIFIESLFVASVAQGILNSEVTIEGYNFDMIFAITAPIVGYLSYKKLLNTKALIIWNFLGLMVIASIIFLFISSIINPQLFGAESIILPAASVKYPYVLVAGFLMPSAVFIHVLSIVQLLKK